MWGAYLLRDSRSEDHPRLPGLEHPRISKLPQDVSGSFCLSYGLTQGVHRTGTATFKALDSSFSVKIPLRPFFGCIGVAPAAGEVRSSIVPEAFGGNMDSPEASVGNTIYFPVNVPGALLYMGDGHAAIVAKWRVRPSKCHCRDACRSA
jgi:Acetamidase/Formamidase family